MREPYSHYAPKPWQAVLIELSRQSDGKPYGKLIASLARRLVGLSGQEAFDIETLGVRMRLDPRRNVAEKRLLFAPSRFDRQERALLKSHLKDSDTFLDIGANIGGYSLWAAACVGTKGRVLAIEPQPNTLKRLMANVAFNPQLPITVIPLAAGAKTETLKMGLSASNEGQGSLKKTDQGAGFVEVDVKPLLDILNENAITRVDALKIDVEGFEESVLVPFFATAPQSLWPKLIILEKGDADWQSDLKGHIESLGYGLKTTTRMNYVLERV